MALDLIIVVFNSSIEEEMREALTEAGMKCFTRIPSVHGVGDCSEPRLGSHIWPGTNTLYLICIDAEARDSIVSAIRRIRQLHAKEGVSAFLLGGVEVL